MKQSNVGDGPEYPIALPTRPPPPMAALQSPALTARLPTGDQRADAGANAPAPVSTLRSVVVQPDKTKVKAPSNIDRKMRIRSPATPRRATPMNRQAVPMHDISGPTSCRNYPWRPR